MRPFLAMIMPVGDSGPVGPVDPGYGVEAPVRPAHPIYLPPGRPVYPTHPIYIQNPDHPENPIVIPPGTPILPVYPVQLPVCPGGPVVIPPGTPITVPPGIDNSLPEGPLYPSHPIVIQRPVDPGFGVGSGPVDPGYGIPDIGSGRPDNTLPSTPQPKRK